MKSDTNYSKAIFDDKMLQIKMGQWLGIIQSTYKKVVFLQSIIFLVQQKI